MPLNVRKFCTSVLLVFIFTIFSLAQTSADVMRDRVAKAKAYIAVKNYNAAIYELENIRRESSDPTVGGVINVLLMNSYLDQGDYKRAQEFLKELSSPQKVNRQNGSANYFTVAGQVVKGARNQLERYKALGLSVSDRNLPLEAMTDVEKMRETLEMVVEQSKVLSKDKNQTSNAMALLEEATNARSSLARDDFDAKRWKDATGDAREMLANSRSVVVNAVDGSTTNAANINTVALNTPSPILNATTQTKSTTNTTTFQPVPNSSINNSNNQQTKPDNSKPVIESLAKIEKATAEIKKPEETRKAESENKDVARNSALQSRNRRVVTPSNENKTETPTVANDAAKNAAPLAVGSLLEYATQKTNPVYPPAARSIRMSGVVKIELVVDEKGQVAEVQKTSGPSMLQRAATDAVRRWKFKPFTRDGQPIKATGFVSFNFSL
ncbi:MAG: energy transducer TonB [Acidobacteria bacterium]|nr:energy transducer TonB [Acidobacteriota bacterium]